MHNIFTFIVITHWFLNSKYVFKLNFKEYSTNNLTIIVILPLAEIDR